MSPARLSSFGLLSESATNYPTLYRLRNSGIRFVIRLLGFITGNNCANRLWRNIGLFRFGIDRHKNHTVGRFLPVNHPIATALAALAIRIGRTHFVDLKGSARNRITRCVSLEQLIENWLDVHFDVAILFRKLAE